MTPVDTAKVTAPTPAPPAHLPAVAKKKWSDTHATALAQAKRDYPDNERAQRTHALKTANAMLSVPAPQSAADIDALEPWQVLHRSTRVVKDAAGEEVEKRLCTTSDGRKYSFPVVAAKKKAGDSDEEDETARTTKGKK